MEQILISYASNHAQWVEGLVVGAVISNPGTCALLFFNILTRIPGVGIWIGRNPDKAKAFADGFDKRIDQLIDQYAAKQAPVNAADGNVQAPK